MSLPHYVTRDYAGGVVQGVQLAAAIGSTDLSFTIVNTTGWVNAANNPLGTVGPFTVVIDQGTATVEKICCSSINLTSGLVTVYDTGGTSGRGYDQTTAQAHVPGGSTTGVQPCWSAVEATEANAAVVYGPGGGGTLTGLTGNPAGKVICTGATYVPSGTTTQVSLNSTVYLKGGITLVSNNFVVPTAGIYDVVGQVSYSYNQTTAYEAYILHNGSQYPGLFPGAWFTGNPQTNARVNLLVMDSISCAVNDTIGLGTYAAVGPVQTDATNLTNTFLIVGLRSK